jgi:hypothetical protein
MPAAQVVWLRFILQGLAYQWGRVTPVTRIDRQRRGRSESAAEARQSGKATGAEDATNVAAFLRQSSGLWWSRL